MKDASVTHLLRPVISDPVQRTFSPSFYVRPYHRLALYSGYDYIIRVEVSWRYFCYHNAQPLRVTQTDGSLPARY